MNGTKRGFYRDALKTVTMQAGICMFCSVTLPRACDFLKVLGRTVLVVWDPKDHLQILKISILWDSRAVLYLVSANQLPAIYLRA